jgi:ADP-ribose pyrophosphatase YjhB (NUDIX family)
MGISEIPVDGFCVSAFLLVWDVDNPRRLLMGHLNPDAPWDHIGALTKDRVEAHSKGWMLPSSHLLYGESPMDAAMRIAREQLEVERPETLGITGPRAFSEVYSPRRFPERKGHWDLEFLYDATVKGIDFLQRKTPNAWRELKFIDIDHVDRGEIARSHEDILAKPV